MHIARTRRRPPPPVEVGPPQTGSSIFPIDRPRFPVTEFKAFYHLACFAGWRDIFHEQLECFQNAFLKPSVFVLGTEEDASYVQRYLPLLGFQANLGWFETPTLDELWKWSREHTDAAVLYCHSKGVSKPWNPNEKCWRQIMMYQVVARWREHLERLTESDCVGIYYNIHRSHPHYAGNFWIARADWVAHLPHPWEHRLWPRNGWLRPPRFHAEAWLMSCPGHRVATLDGDFLSDAMCAEAARQLDSIRSIPPQPEPGRSSAADRDPV
jgi:hypothetical protein